MKTKPQTTKGQSASQNRDKRNAFTEKYGVTGGTLESRQAQHSPLPWRTGDLYHTIFGPPNGNPCPEIIATVNRGNVKANARLIVRSVNNAEKLAEACKAVLRWADVMNLHGTSSEPACVDMCEAALARWEAAQ